MTLLLQTRSLQRFCPGYPPGGWPADLQDRETPSQRASEASFSGSRYDRVADRSRPADIWAARSIPGTSEHRNDRLICPPDRYLFIIALEDTQAAFSHEQSKTFDGGMAAGTVYVACPGETLTVASSGPGDFLHLVVPTSLVLEPSDRGSPGCAANSRILNGLVPGDHLIALMSRFLVEGPHRWPRAQADLLSQLIVTRAVRLLPRRLAKTPLPTWRLNRVRNFIEDHIADPLRLEDLAEAAGLSRMHFAAQFRTATGIRPHDYVLQRRIERAKLLIRSRKLSLVEVALDVGFQSQAHFCTIFKKLTGVTPSAWRCDLAADPVGCSGPDTVRERKAADTGLISRRPLSGVQNPRGSRVEPTMNGGYAPCRHEGRARDHFA